MSTQLGVKSPPLDYGTVGQMKEGARGRERGRGQMRGMNGRVGGCMDSLTDQGPTMETKIFEDSFNHYFHLSE